MPTALLLDIGSTYTKASAFDLEKAELLARARAATTVDTDVTIGLQQALARLEQQGFAWESAEHKLACSSAAGGLQLVAIGLVPELTVEAARRAALGAGAKLQKAYAYKLTPREIEEIETLRPDIILLAGGTDGGNTATILHNARMLADSSLEVPIVIAGNKVAVPEVRNILQSSGKDARETENVMPELEKLNIRPAREVIREIFLERIISAKGLDRAERVIDRVIMPTPAAVLRAAELMAKGVEDVAGFGELMIVDVGGATTDVHTAASGRPGQPRVSQRGLEEPFLKRTVEGDLGMRYSARGAFEAASRESIFQELAVGKAGDTITLDRLKEYVKKINEEVDYLPLNGEEELYDNLLGQICIRIAVHRHCGRVKTIYTPMGQAFVQYGKDLTEIPVVIGTGGVLVNNRQPDVLLAGVLYDEGRPEVLAPKRPRFFLDRDYLLAAIGLLGEIAPRSALQICKKYLKEVDFHD
ncbi:MAG: methylaspartate mutase accessory protein GlmL [Halanaerobium sp.]|nr:methylaspartate mutase accessory protein GlmL [Halanaerobium sp.]